MGTRQRHSSTEQSKDERQGTSAGGHAKRGVVARGGSENGASHAADERARRSRTNERKEQRGEGTKRVRERARERVQLEGAGKEGYKGIRAQRGRRR